MILELQHIYKNYDQDKLVVPVLKDVSLQIDEGGQLPLGGSLWHDGKVSGSSTKFVGVPAPPWGSCRAATEGL